ncbi:autotransporter outer membrane beta-barrel domain-containing protein [Achromobacter arsenitoxydans]|uniref:Autotransporter n=1 Tax=Achromobacter arsenitoxydans SY8 TaxID=477184 RepID=H0FFA6_9BURK|nr:autotransporter outer membrane beta-barrel domain-containing protein [Achromobacter arsenitoxydans]EHK62998.1 autotransporter [Achromobacter arsenitoxydans SY8]
MSRRFSLTPLAVVLSLSFSPLATPYALAIPPDNWQDGGVTSGHIENSASSNYPYIRLENGAVRFGNVINRATLLGGYHNALAISMDSGSILNGSIRNELGAVTHGVGIVDSTVSGSIVNEGEIRGKHIILGFAAQAIAPTNSSVSITGNSRILGSIVNNGSINTDTSFPYFSSNGVAVEITDGSTVEGRIENNGSISGSVVVSGGAVVNGGIVNNGTINSLGTVLMSSGLALDVEGAGAPMVITNTGTILGDVRLGTSTLNLDGGNIYGAIIGEDNQPRRLMASSGGAGTLNVNTDFTPQGTITVGAVNVAADKTLTLSGTKVNGLLTVNGTLAGNGNVGMTTLESGATLSPGTVPSSSHIMMASATLAPGATMAMIPTASQIGTLTVNGDLTFKPGSTYRVDATPEGESDRVNVTGTANLAGSVVHVGSGGTYAPSTSYTILSAGNLNGRFDGVSTNLAYLQPTLNQQGNDVVLTVDMKQVPVEPETKPGDEGGETRPIEFADLAVTRNQRSAANAVQSLPKTSPLYTRVMNLPNGAPAGVFADLSGESFGSNVSAMQNVSNNVASLPTAQLRANMNAGFIPGPPTAQVGRGDASMLPRSAAQPMWAQVFGNWRTMDGNGNVAKSRETDTGVFIGGDHGVGAGWRLGGAFGYTDSRIKVDDRSAKSDVNSYSAILYGGKSFEAGSGKINFTAGLAYTWHDIDSKRNINAAGERQELKADYSASTGQVFTDVGYAFPLTDRVTLEPFFGADFSDLRTRGFSESGGDAALSGKRSTNNVGTTTLGLRAQTTFDVKETAGRLRGMLGWRHAYGDVNPEATMSFDGSQPFTVAGNPLARDAAVMELGVDLAMSKNATLGLAYSGQFGDGNRQNTGTVNVSWRF